MAQIDRTECLEQLGTAIRKKRKEKGYTQRQMCDLIGISSQGYYSEIENGQKDADFVTVVKICRILDVDLNAIIATYM